MNQVPVTAMATPPEPADQSAQSSACAPEPKTKRIFVPPRLIKQGTVAAVTAGFGGSLPFP